MNTVGMLTKQALFAAAGVKQHAELERFLRAIVIDRDSRESFYLKLLDIDRDVYHDTFKAYFEEYSAERKSFQQDYTPDEVSNLLAELTRSDAKGQAGWSGMDPTAGTGSLLIQKWKDDMFQETPWSYAPHNYLYLAQEMADNAIPYLLHNLAIRGMNCVVIHGDTLSGTAKQIYFVQNAKDDYLSFISINVMPHDEIVAEEFGVREWLEDPIDHIEDSLDDVKYIPVLPMRRKALQATSGTVLSKPQNPSLDDYIKVGDVAYVERAKSGKIYPAGTVVVQMSATRGQIGMLTSTGKVAPQYACIYGVRGYTQPYLKLLMQHNAPRYFARVQEGLNLKLEDIEGFPLEHKPDPKQLSLTLV